MSTRPSTARWLRRKPWKKGLTKLIREFRIPRRGKDALCLSVSPSDILYVLGVNGAGKSSLMHAFYSNYHGTARRISAHRQTWFSSNSVTLSPQQKRTTETHILSSDTSPDARWKDDYSAHRTSIAIYDLIDAENVRARAIAGAVDGDDINLAKQLSATDAPIAVINELLQLSNLPIAISVHENEQVMASKLGSELYSIAELSDGERNAILVAANVLTVKPGTLILIDEPERHLHRSIISPLLTLLFTRRSDCPFVISTHEIMLPLDNPSSQTLLVRGCTYEHRAITAWDVDLMPPDAEVDEELKKDILGARRRMLFVEGIESSLDKPLYSLIFPNVTTISKATCRDVERAVKSIRDAHNLHWILAFGVVDNDGRSPENVEHLKAQGVYALSVFSVESIYYHPEMQRAVAERHAEVTGEDGATLVADAKVAAIAAIRTHAQRLSERAAERTLREQVFKHLPGKKKITAAVPIFISLDIPGAVAAERAALEQAIEDGDLTLLIARYPVRDTGALKLLANKLGFKSRDQYESAVRHLLMDNKKVLERVKSMFETLATDIEDGSLLPS